MIVMTQSIASIVMNESCDLIVPIMSPRSVVLLLLIVWLLLVVTAVSNRLVVSSVSNVVNYPAPRFARKGQNITIMRFTRPITVVPGAICMAFVWIVPILASYRNVTADSIVSDARIVLLLPKKPVIADAPIV